MQDENNLFDSYNSQDSDPHVMEQFYADDENETEIVDAPNPLHGRDSTSSEDDVFDPVSPRLSSPGLIGIDSTTRRASTDYSYFWRQKTPAPNVTLNAIPPTPDNRSGNDLI